MTASRELLRDIVAVVRLSARSWRLLLSAARGRSRGHIPAAPTFRLVDEPGEAKVYSLYPGLCRKGTHRFDGPFGRCRCGQVEWPFIRPDMGGNIWPA